jgi:hypothetical protein
MDTRISTLEAKAKTLTGTAKNQLDQSLTQIRARRSAFGADFSQIQSATAVQWDALKTRVDKEWTDLKAAVDKAP